jgi:hypothetical protein
MRPLPLATLILLTPLAAPAAEKKSAAPPALCPVVEVEEDVYKYEPANNGAGPLWCSGSTCLVRIGNDVFASGLETLKNSPPLNNCRWTLYRRGPDGWLLQQADASGRTREPCPLVTLTGGRLWLSANPTMETDPTARHGRSRPELILFSAAASQAPGETLRPEWDGQPEFTEHSYRSFAADGAAGALILFQNIGYTHAEWAFRDGAGRWAAKGKLAWPWGAEYAKPQPIRVCYPNVALRGRAVHFCGVSDIVEPNPTWQEYKKKLTGSGWDYDFRRLFYTWCQDITTGKFQPWVEIASREKTCGWMTPGDMWLAPDGAVHILWTERALDERLRKDFFPQEKQSHALHCAVLRQGQVVSRRTLLNAAEGGPREVPGRGRLHATPDGRLFAFFYVQGADAAGKAVSENRLQELRPDGSVGPQVRVPLRQPFSDCFTATERAGSPPGPVLDLLGHRVHSPLTLGYARIRLW